MRSNGWDILGILFVTLALTVCTLNTPARAAQDFDAFVFWVEPGTKRTVEWIPAANAEGYELYIWQMEGSNPPTKSNVTAPARWNVEQAR